jgi:hypothetical protein
MIENLWGQDAFSMYELTNAINNLPTKPGYLMASGLFAPTPITTTVAVLEEDNGVLALIPNTARGSDPPVEEASDRKVRAIPLMHLPVQGTVKADDVQNVRAFGSTTELQQIGTIVNRKLLRIRNNIEVTREHAMVTATSGAILDSDGSTEIADLFDMYGLTRTAVDFRRPTSRRSVWKLCARSKTPSVRPRVTAKSESCAPTRSSTRLSSTNWFGTHT